MRSQRYVVADVWADEGDRISRMSWTPSNATEPGQPDPDVVAKALPRVADELRIITGRPIDVPPREEIYRSDLTIAWAL
jgi:hypothetical protein